MKEADICNFTDDTTLYKCGRNLDIFSENLEMDAKATKVASTTAKWWQSPKVTAYILSQK